MDESRPVYPWWRRTIAAAAVLLPVAYPSSAEPFAYLAGLGLSSAYDGTGPWPPAVYAYGPLIMLVETPPGRVGALCEIGEGLGRRHAAE